MAIHYLIPLIATFIYLSLLLVVIINRPWQKQHKLFILYLAAATLWGFSNFLLLSNFLIEYKLLLFKIVTVTSMWWAVQLYYFARTFLHLPGGWGIWFGYASAIIFGTVAAIGYAPPSITFSDGVVNPTYGWWFILYVVPLLTLAIMGVYSLVHRLRILTDPRERNKVAYLIIAVGTIAIFGFIGITPLTREYPVTHIGTLLSASILAYAVMKHDLISIRSILRRGLGWASLVVVGTGVYLLVFFLIHLLVGFELRTVTLVLATLAAIVVAILVYWLRPVFLGKVDQLFFRGTYDYRQALLSFNSTMGNIINLDELADEILPTISKALRITQAKLLFQDTSSGDFTTQFAYPEAEGELTDELRFNADNPIIAWLEKETSPLDLKQIDSIPELKGLWQTEKEKLTASNLELLCPLKSRGKLIGILALGRKQSDTLYSHEDIGLVMSMASQAGVIVENAQLYTQATIRANTDGLTGIYNHRHFHERLEQEIGRGSRFGTMFSLIMLDIDLFKAYNDIYGHLVGDEVLRRIGGYIDSSIRSIDLAFRYGGEEFTIILPETRLDDAYRVAERIRKTIESQTSSRAMPITASLGIASWPIDGVMKEEVIGRADAALYRAKQAGRNRTCLSSDAVKPETPIIGAELEARPKALSIIYALAATVDAKDHYTYGHSRKVSDYSVAVAEALNLSQDKIATIRAAGLLHDIGKMAIPDSILTKKETLTDEEWGPIKAHPKLGVEILRHVIDLVNCLPAILHHHERYDGNGYPSGLKGDNIPTEARILAITDAYDAMTSPRPYRDQVSPQQAINEVKRCAGTQFDAELVDIFCKVIQLTPSKRLEVK
jgi:diguanylate cyclase (GGDEF)-like protein